MYGLINNALQGMIREKFSDKVWESVLAKSGVSLDSFLSMRSCDDQITYALVGASSDVLNTPVEDCLRMFGKYWVCEVAEKSYGPLLDAAGSDMVEFLGNMNALHDRISVTFTHFVPPEFTVETLEQGHYLIHYVSTREGLTPFVEGILEGLAMRFDSELHIHDIRFEDCNSGLHAVFEVYLK